MNDLSQYELLSAYLDGELSATEQAEVERLLAARPAARQLLDDLRALSATLQSLPQEKVGEDLSQRVLQAAQRRMLTEGKPDEADISPFAPVPLVRSVFRRFVNRRTLAWLGLTAAIAVAIWINEQRAQVGNRPGGAVAQADREVARTLAKPPAGAAKAAAKTAEGPAAPPSIQATQEGGADSLRIRDRSGDEKAVAPAPAPAARLPRKTAVADQEENPANRTGGGGLGGQAPAMAPAGDKDKAGEAGRLEEKPAQGRPGPAESKRPLDESVAAPKTEAAKKAAPAGPPVLVVLCDVAPAALQKKAFDKLLDANGITGHRQPQRRGLAYGGAGIAGRQSDGINELKEKQATPKGGLSAPREMEAAELIYVEATPAQVKAVLAGLAAQPEVFLAVSAQPVEGQPAAEIVHQYQYERREHAQFKSGLGGGQGFQGKDDSRGPTGPGPTAPGGGPNRPAAPAKPNAAASDGEKADKQAPGAAAPPAAEAPPPPAAAPALPEPSPAAAGGDRKPAGQAPTARAMKRGEAGMPPANSGAEEDQKQQQQPPQPQQSAQSAPPQRVLFVLRVAVGHPPATPKDSAKEAHD